MTDGFTRIFLVNGHGGNHELAQLAARDVALKHPVRVAAGSYWTIAWKALVEAEAHRGRRLPGHAGDFETSIMLSLRPELVPEVRPHRDHIGDSDPTGLRLHGAMRDMAPGEKSMDIRTVRIKLLRKKGRYSAQWPRRRSQPLWSSFTIPENAGDPDRNGERLHTG